MSSLLFKIGYQCRVCERHWLKWWYVFLCSMCFHYYICLLLDLSRFVFFISGAMHSTSPTKQGKEQKTEIEIRVLFVSTQNEINDLPYAYTSYSIHYSWIIARRHISYRCLNHVHLLDGKRDWNILLTTQTLISFQWPTNVRKGDH